ncbi:hypothetical protein K435DRAFT_856791 [Dendrothele bispora CBS 962.96]|uniref:Uncharacterized protein n=1 Tax=Dendrothele bispora (strain CBS 962.96) TaxID=1314807 RepID=A0A4S8M7Q7_DENBC|nr:hypothetical protein K435DRAFT_856791 [Dendrothele bispora CBS 962.96]
MEFDRFDVAYEFDALCMTSTSLWTERVWLKRCTAFRIRETFVPPLTRYCQMISFLQYNHLQLLVIIIPGICTPGSSPGPSAISSLPQTNFAQYQTRPPQRRVLSPITSLSLLRSCPNSSKPVHLITGILESGPVLILILSISASNTKARRQLCMSGRSGLDKHKAHPSRCHSPTTTTSTPYPSLTPERRYVQLVHISKTKNLNLPQLAAACLLAHQSGDPFVQQQTALSLPSHLALKLLGT